MDDGFKGPGTGGAVGQNNRDDVPFQCCWNWGDEVDLVPEVDAQEM